MTSTIEGEGNGFYRVPGDVKYTTLTLTEKKIKKIMNEGWRVNKNLHWLI